MSDLVEMSELREVSLLSLSGTVKPPTREHTILYPSPEVQGCLGLTYAHLTATGVRYDSPETKAMRTG